MKRKQLAIFCSAFVITASTTLTMELTKIPAFDNDAYTLIAQSKTQKMLDTIYNNNSEVQKAFNGISSYLSWNHINKKMSAKEIQNIFEGIIFAAQAHKDQRRKNEAKTPYVTHPLRVATHLMQIGEIYDADTIIAGLLHDTAEDTTTSFEEIKNIFGENVASIVREETDDKTLSREEIKMEQERRAPHLSDAATLVKYADKYDNLTDAPPTTWDKSRKDFYYESAEKIITALRPINYSLRTAGLNVIAQYKKEQLITQ